jgi:hypothetical protein
MSTRRRWSRASLCLAPVAGQPRKAIRTFGTMTADLLELVDWLSSCQVTHVAMESTGVYWKPIVRHEALFDREGMEGPLLRAVAAVC